MVRIYGKRKQPGGTESRYDDEDGGAMSDEAREGDTVPDYADILYTHPRQYSRDKKGKATCARNGSTEVARQIVMGTY